MIYWITGKAGAGKTVLAYKMAYDFKPSGKSVLVLDGDEIRNIFPTGFSDEDRRNHILRIAKIASLAESQDTIVIISLLSPKASWRIEARRLFKESKLIYLPGGELWKDTEYEVPTDEEL